MIFALMLGLSTLQDAPELVSLKIGFDGTQCTVVSDGEPFGVDEVMARASGWAADHRDVRVVDSDDAPESCVTATVFALQQAGIARVEQVREPEPLRIAVLAGAPCRLTVNDAALAIEDLPALAAAAQAGKVKVQLHADRDASYLCLSQALEVLRGHDLIDRVGLVMAPAANP
ncbi:hypothetical protein [Sphingosinithalassobacter portus]|uniref:hypothetical protein n=1 Tax=Stakelama portus TaxID=2676234 RepID=UPI000D6DFDAE|nr:hypothetical protein [Sphingosinithalassobacter portus]